METGSLGTEDTAYPGGFLLTVCVWDGRAGRKVGDTREMCRVASNGPQAFSGDSMMGIWAVWSTSDGMVDIQSAGALVQLSLVID